MAKTSTRHYDDGIHRFDYTVKLKPRLKHRYIRIRNAQAIVTAATRTPEKIIEAFVADRADWIARHLKTDARAASFDLTQPGTQLYWQGTPHTVEIIRGEPDRLDIAHGVATFTVKQSPNHATLLSLLHRYRKQHAPKILLPRVDRWAALMDLHPTRVTFRRARTRWGSCSARNSISLNTHLLMLPDHLIDYVIIHELAHIRHKNHSKAFWACVEIYLPQWRQMRKSIREYEKFLF